MEGRSTDRERRFKVHRMFESSRIEQAMLAAAYRRILPEDRLRFAERHSDAIDCRQGDCQLAPQVNAISIPCYV